MVKDTNTYSYTATAMSIEVLYYVYAANSILSLPGYPGVLCRVSLHEYSLHHECSPQG